MRTQDRDNQQRLDPARALQLLRDGNKRFMENLRANRDLLQQVNETKEGQYPFAVILSCMDSRTSAELIFDQGLGDIFSLRIAGNCLNEDIVGSMEFACNVAGSKLIVVLGHTRCGAIMGACDDVRLGNLTTLLNKIRPAVDDTRDAHSGGAHDSSDADFVEAVARRNVHLAVEDVTQRSPILRGMLESGAIGIAGGVYDISTGSVAFMDERTAPGALPRSRGSNAG